MAYQMQSLADKVFDIMEKKILAGDYPGGAVLTESKLSGELEVSRTPIREAVGRLEHEHLVQVSSKGIQVIGVSTEDIADIYEIRYRLEGLAVRRVCEHVNDQFIREAQEALDLQAFYTERGDSESIKNMDSQFHQILYRYCQSNPLRYTLEPLIMRIVKFRKASLSAPDRAQHSLDEHRAIFEAIICRDPDRAEQLMQEHIRAASTSSLLVAQSQNLE